MLITVCFTNSRIFLILESFSGYNRVLLKLTFSEFHARDNGHPVAIITCSLNWIQSLLTLREKKSWGWDRITLGHLQRMATCGSVRIQLNKTGLASAESWSKVPRIWYKWKCVKKNERKTVLNKFQFQCKEITENKPHLKYQMRNIKVRYVNQCYIGL